MRMIDLSLYLVTCSDQLPSGHSLEWVVRSAIEGGVTVVQLREKELGSDQFLARAIELRRMCSGPVKLIINDRIDIALAAGADGVHLGQEDVPVSKARSMLGAAAIIGVSVNTPEEAVRAAEDGASYLGIGTCWPTGTKKMGEHRIIGPRGVKRIRDHLLSRSIDIPLVTIGGINSKNILRTLYGCRADKSYQTNQAVIGIAVVSAIMTAPDPNQAAIELKNQIQRFQNLIAQTNLEETESEINEDLNEFIQEYFKKKLDEQSIGLVHHLTNTVVQNDCANVTLALNCSPIMSSDINELEDLIYHHNQKGCLIFNLGTLEPNQILSMKLAGMYSNLKGKPIVFDPVGIGASEYRKKTANDLLNHVQISIIKGNQAEITSLLNSNEDNNSEEEEQIKTMGVDSIGNLKNPAKLIKKISNQEQCIVAMTGIIDWISDGNKVFKLSNGHKLLSKITGSGCMTDCC